MDIKKLQRLIVDALEDVKGQDIKVYNTTKLSDMFERVIMATGTSNRQTRALAMSVREAVKKSGGDFVSMEGQDTGEWVLVDCNDAVVHIMQPAIRDYYNLEELWGASPVAMKLATKKGLVKASEQEEDDEDAAESVASPASSPSRAKKSPAKKAPQKLSAKKTVAKKAAAKKAPAKKAPAKSRTSKK
jgi:ribosome-associated protein